MKGGDRGDVAAAPEGPPPPLDWKFSQVFGERTAGEEVQEGKLASMEIIHLNSIYYIFQSILFSYVELWIHRFVFDQGLDEICLFDFVFRSAYY